VSHPLRRSVPCALPVSSGSARSMTSSMSWKATPIFSPKATTGAESSSGALEKMTPMWAAAAISEPVLSASTCR